MPPELAEKTTALERVLRDMGPFALALSGGLDSRFLGHFARCLNLDILALHVSGPHVSEAESAAALAWAEKNVIACTVLRLDPLTLPEVRSNSKERCYHCKRALFTALRDAAGARPLADGSNASDSGEYRPGLRALRELEIRSPLAEAGFTKQDIRDAGRALGLDSPHQTARPCLLTRCAYGMDVDAPLLAALGRAERLVEETLLRHGAVQPLARPEDAADPQAADFRLRLLRPGEAALHLCLPELAPELRGDLEAALQATPFADAAIELVKKTSGYFDQTAGTAKS